MYSALLGIGGSIMRNNDHDKNITANNMTSRSLHLVTNSSNQVQPYGATPKLKHIRTVKF